MQCSCLCGATTFKIQPSNHNVTACHCSLCRRQTSGINMTIAIDKDSMVFSKKDNLAIYDSSAWGERGFCNQCGTNLFWRSKDHSHTNVNAFCLDEAIPDLKLAMEIFIDNKPAFYSFRESTQKLTEADVIALFSGKNNP